MLRFRYAVLGDAFTLVRLTRVGLGLTPHPAAARVHMMQADIANKKENSIVVAENAFGPFGYSHVHIGERYKPAYLSGLYVDHVARCQTKFSVGTHLFEMALVGAALRGAEVMEWNLSTADVASFYLQAAAPYHVQHPERLKMMCSLSGVLPLTRAFA